MISEQCIFIPPGSILAAGDVKVLSFSYSLILNYIYFSNATMNSENLFEMFAEFSSFYSSNGKPKVDLIQTSALLG